MIKFLMTNLFSVCTQSPPPNSLNHPQNEDQVYVLIIFKSPFCVNKEVKGGGGDTSPRTPPPLRHCEAEERYRCQVGCENSRARENWSRRGNNNNKHPGGRAQRMRDP